MKHTARNHIANYLLLLFCLITMAIPVLSYAEGIKLPEFNLFNRGINKGSVISKNEQYEGMPTDILALGTKNPDEDSWTSHSTVTTSLFSLPATTKKSISFMLRSDGFERKRSTLYVTIRYYDKNGVLIASSGNPAFKANYLWTEALVSLAPKDSATHFAEVWFIKYQDSDSTGKNNHPLYLSNIKISDKIPSTDSSD